MNIDVTKIASLARIHLDDKEIQTLGHQLHDIVRYIDSMAELNTEGVAPTAHPHDANMPLRADLVSNGNRRDALLASAPKTESGLFVVPKVIE